MALNGLCVQKSVMKLLLPFTYSHANSKC